MARAKLRVQWDPHVSLLCLLANLFKDKNTPPVRPWDIHPLREREDYDEPTADISILKQLLHGHQ